MAEKCLAHAGPKAEKTLLQNKSVRNYGFAKSARLHLKREFEDVIRGGTKTVKHGIVLWHKSDARAAGDNPGARMGIVVSRRLGIAARRNKAKRLLREVFRLNRHKLKSAAVFVINPRNIEKVKDFDSANKAVFELWQSAGILNDSTAAPQDTNK
ncbi:ribonuclease P protein component [Elusimicrobium posterum]|uniref:ribonuclease P protein component n=1 Tax=Elusimicrobium posterum TaxID=3116653 RepID=UPI003C720555